MWQDPQVLAGVLMACFKSSTGLHHWMEYRGKTICYYCGDELVK